MLCLPETIDGAKQKSLVTALSLKNRFPKEYNDWERSKNQIGCRFKQDSQQKSKIEDDFEGIRVKVKRAIVSELLKTFP